MIGSVKIAKYRRRQHQMQGGKEEGIGERTLVLQGAENIIDFILPKYALIKESIDACFDYDGPSHVTETEPIWQELLKLQKREIKIRFLTDIRKENVMYCKKFLTLRNAEIRHLDSVKGNFGIADKRECFEHAVNKCGGLPTHAIFTTVKGIVESRLFLFDRLWKTSIPAEDRMKEIEKGIPPNFVETLKEPSEIINLGYRLVRSARIEILIIFHTANALRRQDKAGGIDLLIKNATKHKTQIKVLVPVEEKIMDTIKKLERINGIKIRNIETTMQTKITALIVDRMYSLVVELKDDSKETSEEAIGLATYSNSKSTVLSYVSIFETLWRQSELREELMIRTIAQKDFISIAAHELRTPIQPILGLSDILQRSETFLDSSGKDNRAKQKEMIDVIARNAKRLQRLTEDILDITRIEGKTLNLNKQSFVIGNAIRDIVQDYINEIRNSGKNITLSLFISDEFDSVVIVADQDRIKQVISNLIDNAIKFTYEGGVSITVEFDKIHSKMIVNVTDSGTGIDPDILPRLFTKFATKSERGTGLGLYVSKGIIEAHGGRIWAKNKPNGKGTVDDVHKGATISFELPLTNI